MRRKVLSIILIFLSLSELCFAQGTPWPNLNNKFDFQTLQDLVDQAPAGNCRQPEYIDQVKAFLITAVDYYQFIPAANGAFFQQQAPVRDAEPKQLQLSACFVEAMFSAVMPDVLKVHPILKLDRKALIRIFSALMTEREISKDTQDLYAIRTTKLATIAHSLVAISQIRACHFPQDPFIFLAATYRIQVLIDLVYSGMGTLSFIRADTCSAQIYNVNSRNYGELINQKAIQLWMPQ